MERALEQPNFYAILDTAYVARQRWVTHYQSLLRGGAALVQLRAKLQTPAERVVLLDALLPDYAASGRPLIINDDLDVAALYPGMGVGLHIGQDDALPEEARERLGSRALIGLSTHTREQAIDAMELGRDRIIDYFAVGPVFATQTKPDAPAVGLELASWVLAQRPPVPFYCIGGINRSNLNLLTDRGLRHVVAVSDVLLDENPETAVRQYCRALAEEPAPSTSA